MNYGMFIWQVDILIGGQMKGVYMDDNKLNREDIIKEMADKLKYQAYIVGVKPKTFWDNYYDEEIKACVKWSEINKHL
mgnify:CR=1 FL=1